MSTDLFIRRPVLTTLLMAAILLFGIMGFRLLPVSDLPNVDFPTIQVAAALPGASPETMASAVATPLEKQFTTIAGIDSMTSSSALGLTQITIQFSLERNIDAAAQDVQAMITKAAPLLPPSMPTPPTYQKVNPADQPVIYLALSSPTLPLYMVDEYAQTNLAQRISTISGVAQVQVFGSQKYAVRVQLDPRALTTRGIGIDEVEQALTRSNVNLPTGTLYGTHQMFNVMATGQLQNAAAFRPLIVAYRNGSPVRLEELGHVVDGVQTDKVASWYNDERAVILAIQRQPGTNSVEVVDAIRALLPRFRQELPASVNLNVLYDRSVAIRESVHDVEFTLVLAIALVVMVIFLFLRKLWATVIPSVALPLTIIGTFGAIIRMRSPILSRRALFDIGVAGPIAGFVVAVVALVIGLSLSKVVTNEAVYGLHLGEPLLLQFVSWLVLGPIPQGYDVVLHPVGFAAWFGLFVTSLNLIPIGQLDGGHVAYALWGPRQRTVALAMLPVLMMLGFMPGGWPGWFLWAGMAGLVGLGHPPVRDPRAALGRTRIWIGWGTLAIFALTFAPIPFSVY